MPSYLTNLTLRLAAGVGQLADDVRRKQGDWLAGLQRDDGGFAGRQGASDLYYTGFALRSLALLGVLSEDQARRAAAYLEQRLSESLPPVDFMSWVYSAILVDVLFAIDVFATAGHDRRRLVSDYLARFRHADGGYVKTPTSGHSSTYYTFLAATCLDLVGEPIPDAPRTAELIRGRRRPDGGFVELPLLASSGTNPTAAAVALLGMCGALDDSIRTSSSAFLAGMQNVEGGWRAHTRIPIADLLSTFTGLVALADLDALDLADLPAARRYAEHLEAPQGGFLGGLWDDAPDVEYTFYGLAVLALSVSQP